jgi:hypothetical protein
LVSAAPATLGSVASAGVDASTGVAVTSKGVAGALFFVSFNRSASRFFSSVRRKTLIVVRRDLFGLQSSAATGVCSQTGQEEGRVDWPVEIVSKSREDMEIKAMLTRLAYRLLAAWEPERVDSQPTTDRASKLDRDIILGERAARLSVRQLSNTFEKTNLMSSA